MSETPPAAGTRIVDTGQILPISLTYGLVLASLYLLKPARNALFLAHLGIDNLPYVLLLVALIGGIAASVYARISVAVDIRSLIGMTFGALASVLVLFRILLETRAAWVYYAFFVVVALCGLWATSLTWLFANAAFDAHRARRAFGVIGSGGIAGAIVGGLFTGRAASYLGTENLLFVSAGLLVACPLILRRVKITESIPSRHTGRAPVPRGPVAVARTPLARNLAFLTALIAFVAVVVDVQFNEFVDRAYPNQDQKAAFFGDFFAYLSLVSLVFQLFITPFVLRSLGAGFAVAILPLAVGLGSIAILFVPSLLSGALAKGADGGFRHSVHKAAQEVLFLPIPEGIKRPAKLFLDTTVDTTATGLAAISVVLLTSGLGLPHSKLSFLSLGLLAGVVWLVRRTRTTYVDAFRQALDRRSIGLENLRTNMAEADVIRTLIPALNGSNERQVCYVLDLMSSVKSSAVASAAAGLVDHSSAGVRARALVVLENQKPTVDDARMQMLLDDPHASVRLAALRVLIRHAGSDAPALLHRELGHGESCRVATALACLSRLKPAARTQLLTPERLDALLARSKGDRELELALTTALAGFSSPEMSQRFDLQCRSEDPELRTAAIEGIHQFERADRSEWVVSQLADRRTRGPARHALGALGAAAQAPLANALANPATPFEVRRTIPRVLAMGFGKPGAEILGAHLRHPHPVLRRSVLRGAQRARSLDPHLTFDPTLVRTAIRAEIAAHNNRARLHRAFNTSEPRSAAEHLMARALEEKRREAKDNTFLLLALCHDPKDVASVSAGLSSRERRIRATALELLDNILERDLKEPVLRMVDPTRGLPSSHPVGATDALRSLIESPDPWLRACAVFALPAEAIEDGLKVLETACSDPDPVVRDTAQHRLSLLAQAEPERRTQP